MGGIVLGAAAASLAAGVALAFLSVDGSGTGTATTGTVRFGAPVSSSCSYSKMAPGDVVGPCTLSVSYSGSLSAYEALSVLVETTAGTGTGARTLYDPATGGGMTFSLKDDQTSPVAYLLPTAVSACPTAAPAGTTCYELDDEVLSATPVASPHAVTFTLSPTFARSTSNRYQGGSATVVLTVVAVQAPANGISCSATPPSVSPPTPGKPCAASGSFGWS